MLNVPYGQDPYNMIGDYIKNHVAAIEDIIAVIDLDGNITNNLYMVDMDQEGYFIWYNDWYEGEKNVNLITFFPVSKAVKVVRCKNCVFWDQDRNPVVYSGNIDYHYCNIIDRATNSEFFCSEGLEIDNQECEMEVFNKNDMV